MTQTHALRAKTKLNENLVLLHHTTVNLLDMFDHREHAHLTSHFYYFSSQLLFAIIIHFHSISQHMKGQTFVLHLRLQYQNSSAYKSCTNEQKGGI